MSDFMTLTVTGASVTLDPYQGDLRNLRFEHLSSAISPLRHSVPPNSIAGEDPLLKSALTQGVSGEFFGAGWTENNRWCAEEILQSGNEAAARLSLSQPVNGARVEKVLRLRRGEPILYQTHRISGGTGGLSVAHHPTICVAGDGRLNFSMKQVAFTADRAPNQCASRLLYPSQSSDLGRFPGRHALVDLRAVSPDRAQADCVTLIEAVGNDLGWTAVVRKVEDDIIFVLKDPRVLPVTTLRYAQAGHADMGETALAIEDGCVPGEGAAIAGAQAGSVSRYGVPTGLPLASGRVHVVHQAIGALPRPRGWAEVADIRLLGRHLQVMGDTGETVVIPFDP